MIKFNISNGFYILFTLFFSIVLFPISRTLLDIISWLNLGLLNKLIATGVVQVPTVFLMVAFLLWLYLTHLWKLPIIKLVHGMPNVNGRFVGHIKSSNNSGQRYKCVIEIKQTLTNLQVSLFTKKSQSWSIIANPVKNEHGDWALSYVYSNSPKLVSSDSDMQAHRGFATINLLENGKRLEGEYFNHSRERQTYGELLLKFESQKCLGHF